MKQRKFLGWFGLIAFLIGASMVFDSPTSTYSGTFPKNVMMVLNWICWIWFVCTLLALLGMISGQSTRELSMACAFLWTILFICLVIDALSSPVSEVTLTTGQVVRTVLLIFIAPGITMEDAQNNLLEK